MAADVATVDPRVAAARRQAAEARRKIDRHITALEAGLDPALVAQRTRQAQTELTAAEAVLSSAATSTDSLTVEEVVNTLLAVRSVPELLNGADPQVRRGVYKSLGVTLLYRREEEAELIKVDSALQGVDLDCVGGGTCPPTPRQTLLDLAV